MRAATGVKAGILFLSTLSARRATVFVLGAHFFPPDFYPRSPRGGRHHSTGGFTMRKLFLSTLSARRATSPWAIRPARNPYFYPRSPRGGRLYPLDHPREKGGISIHALREEGDFHFAPDARPPKNFYPRSPRGGRPRWSRPQRQRSPISIHALREEGDRAMPFFVKTDSLFLSTLSARRATRHHQRQGDVPSDFYPRSPRGGRPTTADGRAA